MSKANTENLNPGIQRSLFSISWPIFIDLGMHFATLMINMAMVGMVSVEAVAELTVGNQVFDLGLILFNFINIGVCVSTAQALGNGNTRMSRRIIHMALGLNIIWGAIISIAVFFASDLIVELMQVPPEIIESSRNYLMIISLSFLPEALCLCCAQILRAYECTRDSMYMAILINIITIIGNYLFLFGAFGVPKLGVEGVALSTVIGRTAVVGIFIYLIIKRSRVKISCKNHSAFYVCDKEKGSLSYFKYWPSRSR